MTLQGCDDELSIRRDGILTCNCTKELSAFIRERSCHKGEELGWRYLYIIVGVLCFFMAILRSFCLLISESPKWLVLEGKREEAIASINTISRINKSAYIMSNSQLREEQTESHRSMRMTFSMIAGLFARERQVRSMICLSLVWLLVGIAYVSLHFE